MTHEEALAVAQQEFIRIINEPIIDKCERCDGKGYHHGFGEDGHDPDWCDVCGGGGFNGRPGEEERALAAFLSTYLTAMGCESVEKLKQERDEAREALREFLDVTEPASRPAFKDPDYGDRVEALGNEIGYGALITSASASWREVQERKYGFSGGEFVVGPCFSVLTGVRQRARAALSSKESSNAE